MPDAGKGFRGKKKKKPTAKQAHPLSVIHSESRIKLPPAHSPPGNDAERGI